MQAELRRDLVHAIRTKDEVTTAALRSVLAAMANAEAVHPPEARRPDAGGATIAGSLAGVGAAEVDRRQLTKDDVAAILRVEVTERIEAAAEYRRRGHDDRAARLEEEAKILRRYRPDAAS